MVVLGLLMLIFSSSGRSDESVMRPSAPTEKFESFAKGSSCAINSLSRPAIISSAKTRWLRVLDHDEEKEDTRSGVLVHVLEMEVSSSSSLSMRRSCCSMDFAVLLLMVLPRNEGVLAAAVTLEVPVDEGAGNDSSRSISGLLKLVTTVSTRWSRRDRRFLRSQRRVLEVALEELMLCD